ncbi:MAG: hypothetical protein HUJ29_03135 [Gammaproteobacteria bacterium]|nr:hypothetical protein [Gammaproteobacteria bacterium]
MLKNIPWIGLTIGLIFSLVLIQFSPMNETASATLPYLAALFMAELGLIFTAYSAYISGRDIKAGDKSPRMYALLLGNILLAVTLGYMGLALWFSLQAV